MNRYDSYKETSIDWIEVIPCNWDISRSKFLFKNKSQKNFPDEPLLSVTQKDGVVIRSQSDINVWNPTDDVSGYKLIEPGNFVISLRSFEGGLELSKVKGIVSPAYTVLESQKEIDDNYFWWLMKSHQFIIELNKHVTGIRQGKNIGWDDFSNIYLTIPPLEEQKLISRYLDKKINQIDSLIEKIQKKIELLKEQQTSLINQCVTRGLDPYINMKDSRDDIIGDIPNHWNVKPLRYVAELSDKKNNDGIDRRMLSVSQYHGIVEKEYENDDQRRSEEEAANYWIVEDQNLVANTMWLNYRGIGVSREVEGYVSPAYRVYRLDHKTVDPRFIHHLVRSDLYVGIYTKHLKGIRPNSLQVSTYDFQHINIIYPPLEEQKQISHYLDRKTNQIKSMIEKIQKKIKLLKAYRQSLISSIVTGEIKVMEDMV